MSTDQRLTRINQKMVERELHAYLATKTSDIRWLTGFSQIFDEEQAHALLVVSTLATDVPVRLMHTDMRYSSAMRQKNDGVLDVLDDERKAHSKFLVEQIESTIKGKVGSGASIRLGIENDLSLSAYRSLVKAFDESDFSVELVELPGFVIDLRAVKDAQEIEAMRVTQQITDAGYLHMLEYLKPGLTEAEAAVELEFFMRRLGSQGLSFGSIVGSGPNAANPHAVPGTRRLAKGDFVVLDFGAKLDDYRSDMTRTVVLGKASDHQRQIYNTVLEAQLAALAMIKAGLPTVEPFDRVNQIFAERGFGPLTHGLGHGVGIDIHESPVLATGAQDSLVVGHVVTVEPGIYIEGSDGVRIEDFGAVTEDGFDNFTASSKELFEL